MSDLDKLTRIFERFPGVGARQARRFVYHILSLPENDVQELRTQLDTVRNGVIECTQCRRYFSPYETGATVCTICQDPNRDQEKLLIVATDNDLQAVERSGVYNGLYYVLGGTVPLLSEPEAKRIRINGLKQLVNTHIEKNSLSEVILGLPVNPDGENTARFIQNQLAELLEPDHIPIAQLGRGLSTGSELEYADTETLKSALGNRTRQGV